MSKVNELVEKGKGMLQEAMLYWNNPRPGEYVCYREIVMLSIGWLAQYFVVQFTIGFGVGDAFTGQTLGMQHTESLIVSYICQIIGYIQAPVNAWLTDNLRSKHGKYRVYIKLALPLMFLNIICLWFPYEQLRDGVSRYAMIAVLFVFAQIQGYVRSWLITGVTNMVHVMTPNTQERAKIMSITSVIYSFAPTLLNVYMPLMVDVLPINANKFTMTYYRGTFTPLAIFAPLILFAFYGTKERLVIPKSRMENMSFMNSLVSVTKNRIFWIKCFDAWNDFLEGAKGNVWDMLVYRAHVMKSTTYGILNTLCHNAQLWAMIFAPQMIKKFGKKNIKVFKNIMQVFLIAGIGFTYKTKFAIVFLFIINYINRFIDCAEVIDKAIESDMRDTQQYLIGERIDGSFGLVSTYANGAVGMATGLFLPWVYKKCGYDGSDYSVLDVYLDYNPDLPNDQQTKNPNCVLYSMLDVLITISVLGAALDVIPWLFYDVSETGQKSMIRVIRLRTMVEDRDAENKECENYIEGCEAVMKAYEYAGKEKVVPPKAELKRAKLMPKNTQEEKDERLAKIRELRQQIREAEDFNEEIEIAEFVNFEINRFSTDFGKKQLEIARKIVNAGSESFYTVRDEIIKLAYALPESSNKEEKRWRRQEIGNAKELSKSARRAFRYYPDGKIFFDRQIIEDAYNLPDDTPENQKIRRKAMKKANKQQNIYIKVARPYLTALRTVNLAEGYEELDKIISGYDDAVEELTAARAAAEEERLRLAAEQKADAENKKAQRKLRIKK
ncbi:MAG: MFS transporter [Clostridia bacterium]|nr:MFS transporter [Clostridia bacterium]